MSEHSLIPTFKKGTSDYPPGPRFTKEQRKETQETFLKSFAVNGNVRAACIQAGVDRSTVHYWAEHDEEFNIKYNQAKEDVNDIIRSEILKRGIVGEKRYVTSAGKVVYHEGQPLTIQEKSDTLLIFHAKSRMPEYRDKQSIEHSGSIDVTGAKDLLLAKLAAFRKDEVHG